MFIIAEIGQAHESPLTPEGGANISCSSNYKRYVNNS